VLSSLDAFLHDHDNPCLPPGLLIVVLSFVYQVLDANKAFGAEELADGCYVGDNDGLVLSEIGQQPPGQAMFLALIDVDPAE
jgi:hypothetical protein